MKQIINALVKDRGIATVDVFESKNLRKTKKIISESAQECTEDPFKRMRQLAGLE
jgi:hypothetical protein